jgi:hypothetical protein
MGVSVDESWRRSAAGGRNVLTLSSEKAAYSHRLEIVMLKHSVTYRILQTIAHASRMFLSPVLWSESLHFSVAGRPTD